MTYSIDPKNPLPRYYQVYQSLKNRIESGEFPPDTSLPSERQLVVDYNVSRITIVKALDTLVNERLVRREHGRGTFVNTPAVQPDVTLAFVSGVMIHPSIYRVLMGAARVASERGYGLNVVGLHDDGLDTDFALRQIESHNVAGVLTYPRPSKKDLKLYQSLQERGIPLVMIDRYYEEIEADSVVFEEEQASYEMTRHLIEKGHERIAFVTQYEVTASSVIQRIQGYRQAMEESNLFRDDLIWLDVYSDLQISKGKIGSPKNTKRLHKRIIEENVTSFVAVNHDVTERLNYDLVMINVESARAAIDIEDANYEEVSLEIGGFAYQNMADFSSYNVVTALQVSEDLGSKAIELLIARLKGGVKQPAKQVRLPVPILYPETSDIDTD